MNRGEPTLEALQRKVRAQEKTIEVLMRRVEDGFAHRDGAFAIMEESLDLQRVVDRKTAQLAEEHQRLEKAHYDLRRAQAQLLQAQKMESIGQLAAGIAHEINTPTQYVSDNVVFVQRACRSLVELVELALTAQGPEAAPLHEKAKALRYPFLREQLPKAIEQAAEGLRRVGSIVGAMKDFSHPSADRREPVDLRECITTTVTVARNEWKYVADIQTTFDEELAPVPCLRDQINQVLLNLIVNAAHAIAEQRPAGGELGHIDISTRRAPPWAEIRIKDDGGGIPEAIRPRIFDPFFTTKPVGKGTGQGLAIAYSVMVERHHGEIDFESELGVGTTFILRLPLRLPEEAR
jgi:two-component system NtrC family sensor kinase